MTQVRGISMTKKLAALVCGIALVAGCATVTTEQLDAVRATAEAAQNAANEAQRVANEARQAASGAQSTANQALSAAQDAQACCDATNQRLDRMFEQQQQK
ncbi:MAG TPA: Lpp/OprI family alanine-zipper lipoprotein [Gammaproteobacteria bacterium]